MRLGPGWTVFRRRCRICSAEPAGAAHWDRTDRRRCARVGIVWAGNPATKRDRFRSPGLTSIAPLFNVSGVEFIILQVGPGRADLDARSLPPQTSSIWAAGSHRSGRHGGGYFRIGSDDQFLHGAAAPRRSIGRPNLGNDSIRPVFSLAARAHRYALVPEYAPLSARATRA